MTPFKQTHEILPFSKQLSHFSQNINILDNSLGTVLHECHTSNEILISLIYQFQKHLLPSKIWDFNILVALNGLQVEDRWGNLLRCHQIFEPNAG